MVSHLVNSCVIPLGFIESSLEIPEMRPPPLDCALPDVVTNQWRTAASTRTLFPPADATPCLLQTPTPADSTPVLRVALETSRTPEREVRQEAGRTLRMVADLFASSAPPPESWIKTELRSNECRLYLGIAATVVLGVMIFKYFVPR